MVKKIIKWIWYTFVIVAIALIIFRIFMSDSSSVFKNITATDEAKAAFAAGEEILTHRMTQSISDDGVMRCYSFIYIPSEKQVQITVKFNKSIYDKVSGNEKFGFKLYTSESKNLIEASHIDRAEEGLYGYCRAVFDGVEFADGEALEVIMTDSEYTEDYSVYRIHEENMKFKTYKLSKNEKKLLGEEDG